MAHHKNRADKYLLKCYTAVAVVFALRLHDFTMCMNSTNLNDQMQQQFFGKHENGKNICAVLCCSVLGCLGYEAEGQDPRETYSLHIKTCCCFQQ